MFPLCSVAAFFANILVHYYDSWHFHKNIIGLMTNSYVTQNRSYHCVKYWVLDEGKFYSAIKYLG